MEEWFNEHKITNSNVRIAQIEIVRNVVMLAFSFPFTNIHNKTASSPEKDRHKQIIISNQKIIMWLT